MYGKNSDFKIYIIQVILLFLGVYLKNKYETRSVFRSCLMCGIIAKHRKKERAAEVGFCNDSVPKMSETRRTAMELGEPVI